MDNSNQKRHYIDYLNSRFYRLGFTDGKENFVNESNDILEQLHGKINDDLLILYLCQYIRSYYIGENMKTRILVKKKK